MPVPETLHRGWSPVSGVSPPWSRGRVGSRRGIVTKVRPEPKGQVRPTLASPLLPTHRSGTREPRVRARARQNPLRQGRGSVSLMSSRLRRPPDWSVTGARERPQPRRHPSPDNPVRHRDRASQGSGVPTWFGRSRTDSRTRSGCFYCRSPWTSENRPRWGCSPHMGWTKVIEGWSRSPGSPDHNLVGVGSGLTGPRTSGLRPPSGTWESGSSDLPLTSLGEED